MVLHTSRRTKREIVCVNVECSKVCDYENPKRIESDSVIKKEVVECNREY